MTAGWTVVTLDARVDAELEAEMRLSGQSGDARALYVVAQDKRIVILRAFVKKAQRTPRNEIELAFKRARLLHGRRGAR
jgi:phage-related protein